MTTVAILGGRRIDAPHTEPAVFPLAAADRVARAIEAELRRRDVGLLVSSAACGADLLGLVAAERAGIRRRIVLPFAVERFRRESVTDRPGDWEPVFNRQVADAAARGDLEILAEASALPFLAANAAVVARALASGAPPGPAVLVWNGHGRDAEDLTADLAERAAEAGFLRVDLDPMGSP